MQRGNVQMTALGMATVTLQPPSVTATLVGKEKIAPKNRALTTVVAMAIVTLSLEFALVPQDGKERNAQKNDAHMTAQDMGHAMARQASVTVINGTQRMIATQRSVLVSHNAAIKVNATFIRAHAHASTGSLEWTAQIRHAL